MALIPAHPTNSVRDFHKRTSPNALIMAQGCASMKP